MSDRFSTVSFNRRRAGYTLTDLCVLLAFGLLMLAVVMPAVSVRMNGDRDVIICASNLRQLSLVGIMYAGQSTREGGKFPRTYFNPNAEVAVYSSGDTFQAFSTVGPDSPPRPKANDVTTAFYHLLKSTDATPDMFICPASDATPLPRTFGVQKKINFPGPEHLSYSYSTPYAKTTAIQNGWKFDTTLPPSYPVAADINPGDSDKGGPTKVAYTAPPEAMEWANSPNHYYDGQNVAYVDGHVEWQTTPFCGVPLSGQPYRDNIYTAATGGMPLVDGEGGEIMRMPQQRREDFVLLPTIQQTTAGATVTLAARTPGGAPGGIMLFVAIGVGVLLLGAAVVIVVMATRKKPKPLAAIPMSGVPMQAPPPPQYHQGGPPMA